MVCESCRKAGMLQQESARRPAVLALAVAAAELHEECPGGTHCDCQHLPGTRLRADHKADPRRGS